MMRPRDRQLCLDRKRVGMFAAAETLSLTGVALLLAPVFLDAENDPTLVRSLVTFGVVALIASAGLWVWVVRNGFFAEKSALDARELRTSDDGAMGD